MKQIKTYRLSSRWQADLVHPGIGKEKRGIVMGDGGTGGNVRVSMLLTEEINEMRANFVRRPFDGRWRRRWRHFPEKLTRQNGMKDGRGRKKRKKSWK
jgi:hypothetical protein